MVQNIGCLYGERPRIILKSRLIPELWIANDTFTFVAQVQPFVGQVVRAGKIFQGHISRFSHMQYCLLLRSEVLPLPEQHEAIFNSRRTVLSECHPHLLPY